ncbi:MAG TPA: sulfurtransferase [Rhizobiales bacterium]|nr:molybdopterin biosynthesis protein MoeB [bacterium BMS3Bbin10]HDO51888.1 sulfurtransferase [Hyphomicrobiales bacterium]
MTEHIGAETLKAWLSDGNEIALLDVRELGQYGERHLFFAIPLPYSRFELGLPALVPNRQVRLVLYDEADGVAERAAGRAEAAGYENVHILRGGAAGWEAAGYTLYAGVNVPSKTFGELIEHEFDTPRITADRLKAMREAGEDFVLVDGRPFAEFEKVNVPGGICCPNGELALRIADIAPDPGTQVIVCCAGRTRSIIGAQTLIDLGIENPVAALENGTQGWFLAGFENERGASRCYPGEAGKANLSGLRKRTRELAEARGASFVNSEQLAEWLGDETRTTFVFDVRTAEEFAADGVAGSVHAPGGQLVQATDRWVGVKHARLVLVDAEDVRAPMIASWLRQLGHEAHMLEGGIASLAGLELPAARQALGSGGLKRIAPDELAGLMKRDGVRVIDLRPAMSYRRSHIAGAAWSIRPMLSSAAKEDARAAVLVADDAGIAALAALDLEEAGVEIAGLLEGAPDDWKAAGLAMAATPDEPGDGDCIDFIFHTHGRNQGDAAAARAYLAWEIGLVDQLDEQERGVFAIVPAP